jgi:hypothetical protein
MNIEFKKESEEECNLMCEEETIASEGNSNTNNESPNKRVYTYSSEYKRVENIVYDTLILSLNKLS